MNDVEFQLIDCTNINVSTPNSGKTYLQYINGSIIRTGLPNVRRYEIKYSQNCCTETTILIPVRYQFTEAISDCGFSVAPNPSNTVEYSINLLGMSGLFLTKLEISFDGITYTNSLFTTITNGINYGLSFDYSLVLLPLTYYLRLTTVDNFVYTIQLTIEPTGVTPCDNVLHEIVNVTYPTLDNRVYIYPNTGTVLPNLPNTLSLNQLFYPTNPPVSNRTFQSGVVQIVICEYSLTNPNQSTSLISNCIQNNYFIDCNLVCNVINKLVACPNSNLMVYYNALTYSNNCNISYKDKCFLYESFYNKLTMIDCEDPFEDCGKSTALKGMNKPNVRYTSVSPCGCN